MSTSEKINSYWVSRVTFPFSNYLYNRKNIIRNYKSLIKTEKYPENKIREIQLIKLKDLIKYVNRFIPYYRRKFKEIGLNPQDIKKLEDVKLIPPLNRQELIDHCKELVDERFSSSVPVADRHTGEPGEPIAFARFRRHKLVKNTSSGSTGTPTIFYEDGSRSALNWAYELRCKNWFDIQPGAKEARMGSLATKYIPNSKTVEMRRLLWNQLVLPGFNLLEEHYEMCLHNIIKFKPKVLSGIPSALVGLAEYIQKNKVDLFSYRPKLVIGRAEPVYNHEENFLRQVFECPVSDIYGSREVGHIAAKCPDGIFHINQENLLVEIEKTNTGLQNGGLGEILVTTLDESPMPFIRYRMGDIGKLASGECSCGRTLQILSELLGRTKEVFKTKDGHMISPGFWCNIFMDDALARVIKRFQIVYTRSEDIRIIIVRNHNYSPDTEVYLKKLLEKNFDSDTKVDFIYVSDIKPQISGKYQMVKWEK